MWICPSCGRSFANRRQSHACGWYELDALFARSDPSVRATFDRLVEVTETIGPMQVLPEKTRVAFHVRMSFAAFTPRSRWLDGHVVLARVRSDARFRVIQTFSARNHLHAFRLRAPEEVDDEVVSWLAEAYTVGAQRHLGR
jgi:Domain of unknown function (DUF5655)